MKTLKIGRARALHLSFSLTLCGICFINQPVLRAQDRRDSLPARIDIHADLIVGQISPVLYGQSYDIIFEGVKSELTVELKRDRSIDEALYALCLHCYSEHI